ncbi:MAG: hypothetical protein WEF50_13145 [Myxococcota bacterium]
MSRSNCKGLRALCALTAASLIWLAAPTLSRAESFDSFCTEWMGKLAAREQQNMKKIEYTPKAGRVVGSYTGYEKVPVRCQSRAKPGKPGVGTLVYHEVRYQKAGPTVEGAKSSPPEVVEKVEVMEIFRFDGQKWKY